MRSGQAISQISDQGDPAQHVGTVGHTPGSKINRNRTTFTGKRVITVSSSHTSAASFEGIPMDSIITMKVYAVGNVTFNFVSQLPRRGYVRIALIIVGTIVLTRRT